MSSIEQMNVEQLLEQRAKIDAAINAMGGAKTGKNVEKKQKRKSTPAGPWAAWTTKVLAENKEAVEAFKLAAEKKIGAHLKWISENKGKDSAEYKAFAVEFAATHPKVSAPASEASSVVSAPAEAASVASEAAPKKRGPKKLADMTPEERAAHDKKLAERRSKKEAEKVAVETVAKAEVAAPAPVPVAAPEAEAEEEAESQSEGEEALELLPFKLDGVSYFRLGAKSSDGEIAWQGDLWYNKKGVRGSYVGNLQEDGSIDTDAEEPQLE